jgi:penicillin-binding protein 1C
MRSSSRLSKDEILDLYLTLAPYGGNIEGVRAASLAYFGKEPARLTTAEAALLVALPQSPEARRPDRDPRRPRSARPRARPHGDARACIIPPRKPRPRGASRSPRRASSRCSPRTLPRKRCGRTPARGSRTLTIDRTPAGLRSSASPPTRARQLGQNSLGRHRRRRSAERRHPRLGRLGRPVLRDRERGFVDMTKAVRSPGSTLKPLIYGLAFELGLAHPGKPDRGPAHRFGDYTRSISTASPRHGDDPAGADSSRSTSRP